MSGQQKNTGRRILSAGSSTLLYQTLNVTSEAGLLQDDRFSRADLFGACTIGIAPTQAVEMRARSPFESNDVPKLKAEAVGPLSCNSSNFRDASCQVGNLSFGTHHIT